MADMASPRKRPRLSVDLGHPGEATVETGLHVTAENVGRALEKHKLGEDAAYDRLKHVFTTSATSDHAPSPALLRRHVLALISNASRLDRSCSGLVHAVLGSDWVGRDESHVALFVRFLGNLVSAQGSYVGSVLDMLVEKFCSVPHSAGRLPNYPRVRRSQIYTRSHTALKYVLQLVPSASSALVAILAADFPHSSNSKKAHTDFVENLIHLSQYAPELKAEIIGLITERLVKIDVQVQVDMEDLEEDEVEEGLVQDASAPQSSQATEEGGASTDDADSDVDSVESDGSMNEQRRRVKELKASVGKMDAILDILFEFYSPTFSGSSVIKKEQSFDLLLNQFANIILPTYRSRHSQFLVFHFAQTSEVLTDKFAGACIHLMCDKTRPALLRQSAAAYLASFIARGAHVSTQVVRDVFQLLSVHLDKIRADQESTVRRADLRRHRTFHSMVQALLYIFCFRWRDLTDDPSSAVDEDTGYFEGREFRWVPGVKESLSRTIYSKFNPLKVCSPSIVNEFARIANHLRFMYIYPLLESNRRLHLSELALSSIRSSQSQAAEGSSNVLKGESPNHLDAYFPFDPYHLPVSKRWLKGDYVEWRGIPTLDNGLKDDQHTDSDEAD